MIIVKIISAKLLLLLLLSISHIALDSRGLRPTSCQQHTTIVIHYYFYYYNYNYITTNYFIIEITTIAIHLCCNTLSFLLL